MTNLNLHNIYRFSKSLKIESIKKEALNGFNLKDIKLNSDKS